MLIIQMLEIIYLHFLMSHQLICLFPSASGGAFAGGTPEGNARAVKQAWRRC